MHYHLHRDWLISAQQREAAPAKRNQVITERYNSTTHQLPPLDAGMRVVLQNRRSKWDHMGENRTDCRGSPQSTVHSLHGWLR